VDPRRLDELRLATLEGIGRGISNATNTRIADIETSPSSSARRVLGMWSSARAIRTCSRAAPTRP
jgi:hypothetical protein